METNNKRTGFKKAMKVLVIGTISILSLGTLCWIFHKPVEGDHNYRSFFRSDGVHKKRFSSAPRANLQCIIQLVTHGELCFPYKEGEKEYYTGHRHRKSIYS